MTSSCSEYDPEIQQKPQVVDLRLFYIKISLSVLKPCGSISFKHIKHILCNCSGTFGIMFKIIPALPAFRAGYPAAEISNKAEAVLHKLYGIFL